MIVLDAWAAVELVLAKPAHAAVRALIEARGARMSWINAGEMAYTVERSLGRSEAAAVVRNLGASIRLELPDERLVLAAARLKARGGVSYADCFGVATALRHREPIVTGDPEIVALHGADGLEVIDPR